MDQSSPGFAGRFLARLIDAVDVLDQFPHIGRTVEEVDSPPLRELIFQNYRVVYAVVDGRPWLLAVIHGAADMRQALRRRGLGGS